MANGVERGQWKSKLGFILAASGSAIGLGNIVFFSANAYKYGAGAFYLPYLIALMVIGIPVMILELGLGHSQKAAFPEALGRIAGKRGEFTGWWALINAGFITMYYITILGWVLGMFIGSFGELWKASVAVPAFGFSEGDLPNPYAYFFNMLASWKTVLFVVIVWIANIISISGGTRTIERVVKVSVPLMWLFMIILIIRGVTLPNGIEGIYLLFTPHFDVIKNIEVWQGAFSQMFFTLSLGFGIMATYASYLPEKSDQTGNGLMIAFMNCGFEFIAGLAIFSLLFTFAIVPKASTLSMMFFVVPQGIAEFPGISMIIFGLMFFFLLFIAGLTSSISLVEALISAVIDKFNVPRRQVLIPAVILGSLGSILFALPMVVDSGLNSDGTLGLTLLDLTDHWAFSYGLMIMGLIECVLIGWVFGAENIREHLNANSPIQIHWTFNWLIKLVIPGIILFVLGFSIWGEYQNGLYGHDFVVENLAVANILHVLVFLGWLIIPIVGAAVLTSLKAGKEAT
ncbi:MAG: hypothetical protein D6675_12125 [Gemmatimonadetes bacterium]|nr:MAG: hypothetical protein D6675_12125 [Gemmatimonadota bacterium]